jgi:hypothetical protein
MYNKYVAGKRVDDDSINEGTVYHMQQQLGETRVKRE